jgi:hypothetical protein
MWVHGNAFVPPEAPGPGRFLNVGNTEWTDLMGLHRGFHVTWRGRGGQGNWFHVAIPTPAVVNDTQMHLDKAYVLFRAGASAMVSAVTVWDGQRLLQSFTVGVGLDHCGGTDPFNTFDLTSNPAIFSGVGISVGVTFPADDEITFCGAGADFVA